MLLCTRPNLPTSQQDGRRESSLLAEERLTVDGWQERGSQFLLTSMPLVIDYVPVNDPISTHIWTALIRPNGMQEIKGVYDVCGNWKKRW